ncbi:MAG: cell division protein FtsA [Verrucomicrobiota bacterium]
MLSRTKFIGAVEIGTSRITVIIGQIARGRSLSLIGLGECPSRGVSKGTVVDFKAATECVHAALEEAERSAGARVGEVFLAQSGAHLEGFQNEAEVRVSAADNMVSTLDIENVCGLAKSKQLPEGRMVVHHLRRPFRLDGRLVPDPEHLDGRRLEVGYWTVHGQESRIADHLHVIRGFNVRVTELILSSLASGSVMTSTDDRRHGVLVLDLGAGTTDYVLYRDGCALLTGVVPVGGLHFSNDLSLGLRLNDQDQAEKLKLRYGRAVVTTKDRTEKVWLHGDLSIGDRQFPRLTIEQITAARARELFEVVRKKLGGNFDPEYTAAGVVLTGGGSKLAGIEEVAAQVFDVPARFGEPPGWVGDHLRAPGHSTALGLLHYGLGASPESLLAHRPATVGRLLRNFFTAGN